MVMATVGPEAVISVAERLAQGGVAVVDAPVSGGTARAASGDLLIMVSGPQGPVERAQPLLSALARSAPVVGSSPGDGQRMKLVNQLLCGVHIAAAAEALAFAEALGLTCGCRKPAPPGQMLCRSRLARSRVSGAGRQVLVRPEVG